MIESVHVHALSETVEMSKHALDRASERGISLAALGRLAAVGEIWRSRRALYVVAPAQSTTLAFSAREK